MKNSQETIDPTVQEIYQQAVNAGTLEEQRDTMEEIAEELGTTMEALDANRLAREKEAAARLKINPNIVVGPNDSDNWRVNEG